MTSIGGRPVQAETPPEDAEAARAGAAAGGPDAGDDGAHARTRRRRGRPPAPAVKQAPDEARGRTPTRGAETSAGSAVAETGARGQGFGLSTGGGAARDRGSTSPTSAVPTT